MYQKEYRYMLRFTMQPGHYEEERVKQLISFCLQAKIDDVTFIVNGEELNQGHITKRKLEPWLNMLVRARDQLNRHNISMSINPWTTLHHTDRGRILESEHNFNRMVDIHGNVASVQICPLCESWRQYIVEVYRLYAELLPDILWLEDDFRYHNHSPLVWGGCFCDLHMAEYSKMAGIDLRREEFVSGLLKPGHPHKYRKIWLDTCKDTFVNIARSIGSAVHVVSPKTKVGLMSSVPWVHSAEGRDWRGILEALAGENELVNRPHLPAYSEISPQEYLWNFCTISRLSRAMVPAETITYPELENYPYTSFSKSNAFMKMQLYTSLIINAKGMTMNIFDMMGNGILDSEGYGTLLSANKEFFTQLSGLQLLPENIKGIKVMFDSMSSYTIHTTHESGMEELYPTEYLWAGILTCMGISNTYCTDRDLKGNILAISGQYLRNLTGQEIRSFFINNHVILDGESACVLYEMGFGELAGIKSCKWHKCDSGFVSFEQVCSGRICCGIEGARVSSQSIAGDFLEIEYGDKAAALTDAKNAMGETVANGMMLYDNRVFILPYGHFSGKPQPLLNTVRQKLIQEMLLEWAGTGGVVFTEGKPYIGTFFYETSDKYVLMLFNSSLDETGEIKIYAPDLKFGEIFEINSNTFTNSLANTSCDGEYVILNQGLKSMELKVFYKKRF